MTTEDFLALQQRVACPIATERDIEAWVTAVLAGEPKDPATDHGAAFEAWRS